MKATLKDIAADTGFSVTTVSLVLNNKPSKIPEGTKQIILEAAQRLGYRPNQLAVSLVKKRTDTLGLIVSDVSNPFFSTLAKGVEDICRENGCNMILCNTNNMHKCDLNYINMLVDKGVDGIIYGMAGDSTLKNAIDSCNLMKEQDMSFVIIDRYFKKLHTSYIGVDHLMGGYYATKHLIEMGHKKIACITGPLHLDDVLERLKGYKKALKEAGIKYDSKLVFEGRYNMESGAAAFPWLMKTKCTAVFAFNDMTAYGLYIEAKKNGVSIPKDFSVVGYDDIYFSKILEAPLTTIKQPVYEMGVKATEILIEAIKNKKKPEEQFVYQPELVVRCSTRKLE